MVIQNNRSHFNTSASSSLISQDSTYQVWPKRNDYTAVNCFENGTAPCCVVLTLRYREELATRWDSTITATLNATTANSSSSQNPRCKTSPLDISKVNFLTSNPIYAGVN